MRNTVFLIIIFIFAFSCFSPSPVLAFNFTEDSGLQATAVGTGHTEAGMTDSSAKGFGRVIGSYLKILTSFIGVIFLVLMIYGGFVWMTARGDEQRVVKAKSIIINSLIGLLVVMSAFAITNLVMNNTRSTGNPAEEAADFDSCVPPGCVWTEDGPIYVEDLSL